MKNIFSRLDKALLKAVRVLTAIQLLIMFVVITSAVIFRYVLDSPTFWTEEFARYAMFYMVLLGSAVAMRNEQHPALTFVIQKFPTAFFSKWKLLLDVLIFLVLVVVLTEGYKMAREEWIGKTAALRIRFFWVYLALPIGAFLMMVQIVAKYILTSAVTKRNSEPLLPPKED